MEQQKFVDEFKLTCLIFRNLGHFDSLTNSIVAVFKGEFQRQNKLKQVEIRAIFYYNLTEIKGKVFGRLGSNHEKETAQL